MSEVLGSIHVLLVEDEPGFARLVVESLEANGHISVDTATTPDEALDRLTEFDVDCVVSDYEMPGRNGLEFLEMVRERDPEVPFILFTGKGSEEVASRAISAGATDYLRKESGIGQFEVLTNRIQNVVAKHRAERAAQATRRRFQRLIEKSTDVIIVVDTEGNFAYLSPAAERVLGYPPDELVGENGFDFIHEDDRDATMARFSAMVDDPSVAPAVEFRFQQPDGSWRWLEARGRNLLEDPVVNGIVVYARDITDRKANERTLKRERNRYRGLFEGVPEPTVRIAFDEQDRPIVREVNAAFETVFGYAEAELRGRSIDDFVVPAGAEDEADRIRQTTARGEPVEQEVRRQTVWGEREFLLRTNPLTINGDSTESIGIYVDVTAAKERERMLERWNEQLEEFASVVSHDLRNPLNVAAGHLELAMETGDNQHLEAVQGAHSRMATLIDDLLTLAREGEKVGDLESIDLADLATRCWGEIETNEATLAAETTRTIRGDRSRLKQLLINLFWNAVDHGGPTVTVTVGDLDDGFFVEDDGPGIQADDRPQVFKPGYSTTGDGTGFGLSIVRGIAEAHGWSIDVTDGPAGGARFLVRGVAIEESERPRA